MLQTCIICTIFKRDRLPFVTQSMNMEDIERGTEENQEM
jgi:hypothetical protein